MKQYYLTSLFLISLTSLLNAQQWQDVGGGLNNSSHCMTTWNGMLVDGGSFGSPCGRIAAWNGTSGAALVPELAWWPGTPLYIMETWW